MFKGSIANKFLKKGNSSKGTSSKPRNRDIPQVYSTPRQKVIFYVYRDKDISSRIEKSNINKVVPLDVTDAVKEIQYSATKLSPSGRFEISLASNKQWEVRIRPGDWVLIYCSQQAPLIIGKNQGLICIGNVDHIARNVKVNDDGRKSVTYSIIGRDFGKIFETSKFYYNMYTELADKFTPLILGGAGIPIQGDPGTVILNLLDACLGDGSFYKQQSAEVDKFLNNLRQMVLPKEISKIFGDSSGLILNIIRIRIGNFIIFRRNGQLFYFDERDRTPVEKPLERSIAEQNDKAFSCLFKDERLFDKNSLIPIGIVSGLNKTRDVVSGNSIWDLLVSSLDTTVNELYTSMDYYPSYNSIYPTITLRRVPFTQKNYSNVMTTVLSTKSIQQETLGFNDDERVNNIYVYDCSLSNMSKPKIVAHGIANALSPEFNENSVRKDVHILPYQDDISIQRYGNRQVMIDINYIFNLNESGELNPNNDVTKDQSMMLTEVLSNNHRCESGTIVVKGFYRKDYADQKYITDFLNVGQNIYIPQRHKMYHIEAVAITWRAPGQVQWTLTVTHGVYKKNMKDSKFLYVDETYNYDDFNQGKNEYISSTFTKRND